MATIVKIDSTEVEDTFRTAKVEQYGAKTADLVQPFGDDSNPIKDMVAVFAETDTDGNPIIIGYLNSGVLAAVGEKRLYSVGSDGTQKAYVWLKNNGQLELNGKGDNVVRYSELASMMDKLKNDINIELTKIQTGIIGAKSSYAKKDISIDPSKCKVDNVEVK